MIDDPLNRTQVKRGESLPQSKLTNDDVLLIRELDEERKYHAKKASDLKRANIADKFGVHVRTIERILSMEAWTHVD